MTLTYRWVLSLIALALGALTLSLPARATQRAWQHERVSKCPTYGDDPSPYRNANSLSRGCAAESVR